MKIAVWQTDHEISQTVSKSLAKGFAADLLRTKDLWRSDFTKYDVHIAYGILRGTADVFKRSDTYEIPWFNVDRGYFNPSHYDGYYRLSYRGTQAKWHDNGPKREHSLEFITEPHGPLTMVCPPSIHVQQFFGIDYQQWCFDAARQAGYYSFTREKLDEGEIPWHDVGRVITFNSTVAVEAMRRGIPVISDPTYSAIGSYQATKSIDTQGRNELFNFMRAHDFTLDEIERGAARPLLEHYLERHKSIHRL